MKKKIGTIILIAFIVIVSFIIIITLVGNHDHDDASKTIEDYDATNTETQDEISTTYFIGDTVTDKNVDYTITNVTYSDGTEFDQPADGKVYVIVTLQINNHSTNTISYNPFDYRIRNMQGQIDDQCFTTIDSDTNLHSGDLAPEGNVSGTIVFEESKEDTDLVFCKYNSFTNESYFEIHLNQ